MRLKELLNGVMKRALFAAYGLGCLLLVVSGWFWWDKILTNPTRVFYGMVDQGLATSSVTLRTMQDNGQTKAKQTVSYQTSPSYVAMSWSTLQQDNAGTVVTQIIGTPSADYARYTKIEVKNAPAGTILPDYSKIINKWVKTSETKTDGLQVNAQRQQLYAQAVVGLGLPIGGMPVPLGNLPRDQRATLVKQIKKDDMYGIAKAKVTKTKLNGRLTYVYETKIKTASYVQFMKKFAKNEGLKELEEIDAQAYKSAQPLAVKMTVDVRAHRLVSVEQANGATQTYENYDVPLKVELPKNTITNEQLQQLMM
jgi:hypothetical protein